jgi:hypothetical protein
MRTLLLFLLTVVTCDAQFAPPPALVSSKKRADEGGGVDPNLVGWWKLNDGSGTSAADATGNGNTGTLANTTWGTGPNSNGDAVFDGTGDLITIANESNFDFERTDAFSITFWMKGNSSATGSDAVFDKSAPSGNFQGFIVQHNADNALVNVALLDASGNALQAPTANGSITLNTWYFIAVTYDGSSLGAGLKTYINAGTAVTGTGTLSNTILNNASPYIGFGNGLAGDFFGELDDVRVYDKELTSGEISSLNSGGAQ